VTSKGPSLSLAIPIYNEARNIERVLKKVVSALSDWTDDFEIILVESGSTDGTRELVRRLSQEDPRIRVIHEMNREGYGNAIKLGLTNGTKEIVGYIDADEPFDTMRIGEGLEHLKEHDAVIGYRIGPRENVKRLIVSRTYNVMIRLLFGLRVRDVNFSFKVFHRRVLDRIRVRSRGAFIDAELLLEARKAGFRMYEHGFEFMPRDTGDSTLFRVSVVCNILLEMVRYWLGPWRVHLTAGRHPEDNKQLPAR